MISSVEIDESNEEQTKMFCPQISDFCVRKCVCFVEARIVPEGTGPGGSKINEHLEAAYCNHFLHNTDVIAVEMF